MATRVLLESGEAGATLWENGKGGEGIGGRKRNCTFRKGEKEKRLEKELVII